MTYILHEELPKKCERILKWERTATVFDVFRSELVDFEGTFGGYLYNLLVRLICAISPQVMVIFLYFHSECVIEPQH